MHSYGRRTSRRPRALPTPERSRKNDSAAEPSAPSDTGGCDDARAATRGTHGTSRRHGRPPMRHWDQALTAGGCLNMSGPSRWRPSLAGASRSRPSYACALGTDVDTRTQVRAAPPVQDAATLECSGTHGPEERIASPPRAAAGKDVAERIASPPRSSLRQD